MKKLKPDIVKSKLVEECFKGLDLQKPTEKPCERMDGEFCSVYPFPAALWRHGRICLMATHTTFVEKGPTEKVRVGQQKQKKK